MRLTSKGRYAVTAMAWTLRSTPNPVRYRWQIFLNVRVSPFLIWSSCSLVCVKMALWASVRGPGGGYLLG
ncbi:HTH-type transcriptional regulator iscR [Cronobacter sakazakii]|nr:HTH-type transcriptional regulator iscR [Cronobacter sakazakii]